MPLDAAQGRVAARDVRAAVDLPAFDRSAMDGFAVRAADTDPPAPLRIAGEVAAGEVAASALAAGTAVGITTGAALPEGADAILRVEDATVADGSGDAGRAAAARLPRPLPRRGRRAR